MPARSDTLHAILIFIVGFVASCGFIMARGGFSSDLGGDPDEAAHAVTALMVSDYVKEGLGQQPMQFAKTYYADFPRVALGHYPPLFYLVAAPFLMALPEVSVLLVLQAFFLASLSALTYLMGRRLLSPGLALLAGLSTLAIPVALKLTLHVMSDILFAVFCLWAALLWAGFLRAPSMRRSLLWGCVAAGAILTKGSGVGLCLLPPLSTLLARQWRLLLTPSWWCAALPVALFAGPWMLYSTKISKEGMTQLSPIQYFLEAVPYHLKAVPELFGWPLTILTVMGLIYGIKAGYKQKILSFEAASLTGMAIGVIAVLLLVPVGLSTRYMLTLVPVVVIIAAYGMNVIPWPSRTSHIVKPLLLAAFICVPLIRDGVPQKQVLGFTTAVIKSGMPKIGDPKRNWLVASDPRGEGAIIAAATFHCLQRSPSLLRIYRGSKELGSSDWMGRNYKQAFTQEGELLEHLDKVQVSRVFVDLSVPAKRQSPHEHLLLKALQSAESRWQLEFDQPITRRPTETGMLLVYQRKTTDSANPSH